jgi:microcystin-dependent protein
MRHRPSRDSGDDSQTRVAPPADASATLNERAVAAARAELRGERTGILGATGRLSLPRLEPPRRVPERWTFVSVSSQITLRMYIGTTWVPMVVADTSTGAIIDDPLSPKNWVAASGTHDAITATYDPPVVGPLPDGLVLSFRATSANLTTAPTFSPNGLGAGVITKNGGQSLAIGDIPGSLAEVQLRWNLAQTRFELLNPPAVPVGGIVPYFGGTLPSGYALPQGQNLSATTFPAANAVLGTTYGNPGGGNFTMPDMRGRFPFNLDSGGSNRLSGVISNSSTLGATGGAQNQAIAQANLPSVNFAVSGVANGTPNGNIAPLGVIVDPGPTFIVDYTFTATAGGTDFMGVAGLSSATSGNLPFSVPVASQGSAASGGSGTALPTVPPGFGVNCMMRIA